jgi:hypothetical protein
MRWASIFECTTGSVAVSGYRKLTRTEIHRWNCYTSSSFLEELTRGERIMAITCNPDPPKAGQWVTITAMSPGVAASSTLTVIGALSGETSGGSSVSFRGSLDKDTAFGSFQATARYKDLQGHTTHESQSFNIAK